MTNAKNDFTVGKEPDHSFNFQTEKDIPNLAIEVVFSSGGVSDLEKYKYLQVPEVWIWQNKKIEFYQLGDSEYQAIAVSNCMPKLSSEFLIEFVNRGLEESPLIIEADFIAQLN